MIALRALETLGRHAAPVLAASLFVGILLPDLAAMLRPLVAPAIVGLMACNVARVDWQRIVGVLATPGRAAAALAWIMIGAPLLFAGLLAPLDLPAPLREAILLTVSSPVLTAAPAFVLMMDLDGGLAVFAVIASSLLQPVIQPPLAHWLLGLSLDLSPAQLMLRLALFVGAGFLVGAALRLAAGPARVARADKAIGGMAVALLIVFGIGVMDGTTALILSDPGMVLLYLAAGFATHLLAQAAGVALFWPMARDVGLTVALVGGCRNLANLVAAMGPAAGPELALFLAVGQFPLYFVPILCGPAYRRLRALRTR
ncbi:MAG: hypothetical protein ACK51F_18585 [Rhodospirillales bacterium]|jgi:BASS family bile acid:Na+ symporter